MSRNKAERANKLLPVRLYEITYRPEPDSEPVKVRVVASNPIWPYTEIFKRRYKGKDKQYVSVDDLGPVIISEPHRKLEEVLSERADQIGAVIEATAKDIAALDFGATVLDKHRANMQKFEKVKHRLSNPPEAAPAESEPTEPDTNKWLVSIVQSSATKAVAYILFKMPA